MSRQRLCVLSFPVSCFRAAEQRQDDQRTPDRTSSEPTSLLSLGSYQ